MPALRPSNSIAREPAHRYGKSRGWGHPARTKYSRPASFITILLVVVAPAVGSSSGAPDVAKGEAYLEPYLDQLAEFRRNPIAEKYIRLAKLVDFLPAWLEDWFVPLFLPHSTLTIPIELHIPLHLGPFRLPATISLVNATLTNLNEFTKLRPLELLEGGRFTWRSQLALRRTTLTIAAQLVVPFHRVDVQLSLPAENVALEAAYIVAFNRTSVCEVWGAAMQSSASCALWPVFAKEQGSDDVGPFSGLNITELRLVASALGDAKVEVIGLRSRADALLATWAANELGQLRPWLLQQLPGPLSAALRREVDTLLARQVIQAQRQSPRQCGQPAPVASRVCVVNNGGFALKWAFHDCPAHTVSAQTPAFPADVEKCMDISSAIPGVVQDQLVRIETQAIAGVHAIAGPSLRYRPDSNIAGLVCAGSTLLYSCTLTSLAPISPAAPAPASEVCIINDAGFAIRFEARDNRSGTATFAAGGPFAAGRTRCLALSEVPGILEGDVVETLVHAIGGRTRSVQRLLEYQREGPPVAFQCKGSTMVYSCRLEAMALPATSPESTQTMDGFARGLLV